jgi:hypothetical protein
MPISADSERPDFSRRPAPEREEEIARLALDGLRARLPERWALDVTAPRALPDLGIDLVATLRDPGGVERVLLVEVKRRLETREVRNVVWRLDSMRGSSSPADDAQPLVVARYLSPPTRERLVEAGMSYVDVTGNMNLALDRPAIFLRDVGAQSDPWRGPGRPRDTLTGAPAARIVRALADFREPGTVPQLAQKAGASIAATYRVVDLAEQEGLLERQPRGPLSNVRWRPLLERWSRDYRFMENSITISALAPRGIEDLAARLRAAPKDFTYALTGSLAAQHLAAHAPARAAALYVTDFDRALTQLDLRPLDNGANVILVAGDLDVVFERTEDDDGLRVVAPSQAAVDLLNGPGRNPAEGEELLTWMERNEPRWRR